MHNKRVTTSFRIAALIRKYLQDRISETEKKELNDWLNTDEQNRQLFQELTSAADLERQLEAFKHSDSEAGWKRLQNKISGKAVKPGIVFNWKFLGRAAAIIILALAAWQVLYHTGNKPPDEKSLASQYGEDVLPGYKKAELVLSNGNTVALTGNTDSVFTENGIAVQRKANGEILYAKGTNNIEAAWNMIRVPNGGEYKLQLEDGTVVWLNAATTLRYPVQFTGSERKVELLEGEAFFEIARNKEKPFTVVADGMEVLALGTAFNVNSYPVADSSSSTTLTHGRIKVTAGKNTRLLQPGEQVTTNKTNAVVSKADVEAVTAWKNGLFLFNNAQFEQVMQQVARWYDVKVTYDKEFKEKKFFTGEIKRNVPVSKLLQMMELTGIARFRITNNTIIVLPYTP